MLNMLKKILLLLLVNSSFLLSQKILIQSETYQVVGVVDDIDLGKNVQGGCIISVLLEDGRSYKNIDTTKLSKTTQKVIKRGEGIFIKKKKGAKLCRIDTTISQIVPPSEITDKEGNVYPLVNINGELWMAEDLRYKGLKAGNHIVTDSGKVLYTMNGEILIARSADAFDKSEISFKLLIVGPKDWKKAFENYGEELFEGGSTGLNLSKSEELSFCSAEEKACEDGLPQYWTGVYQPESIADFPKAYNSENGTFKDDFPAEVTYMKINPKDLSQVDTLQKRLHKNYLFVRYKVINYF